MVDDFESLGHVNNKRGEDEGKAGGVKEDVGPATDLVEEEISHRRKLKEKKN
jgi:hypothetical protein